MAGKIDGISSSLNLQTITPFSYFRREVSARRICVGEVCRKLRKAESKKKRNTCNNCVSISHSRRMWDGAKS